MKKKVEIIIEQRESHISVGFNGPRYGSGSPCDSEEEVRSTIEGCKKWIEREGDTFIITDKRKKPGLLAFTGNPNTESDFWKKERKV